ncbi:MAG: M1 family peptidase [Ignavibacteriae bacterium]|nr:MAG: M1 family peptidase [Ignavibacteriota bacterium]
MHHRLISTFVITILLVISVHPFLFGQDDLYLPLNIKKAYENGTRNYDGTPGLNYWQNSSDYKIKVEIDPEKKMLYGSETITYYNNSPDTLKTLVIRLYQDIFKIGNARDFSTKKEVINDGVNLSKIIVNGEEVDTTSSIKKIRRGTNLILKLEDPVPPQANIKLAFEWYFIIPNKTTFRMGAYDSTSFFIGYWYPQMAVYDDIDGWDYNNYGGYQEFYNDFSNFDVEIKVPNTFAVWSTGILQNPDELLTQQTLDRFNSAHNSDEVVRIVTEEDLNDGNIFNNSSSHNVWKYKTDKVPDFAFALSDHYLWDAVTTVVDSSADRTVFIQAAYKVESDDFYNVADISKKAIEFFSFEIPAVPFPYPSLTVFNGSGGMEYPMMVNDGSAKSKAGTVGVTSHEIAHTYFPFYMGTNERKYAFMDEGWAVMLPYDFQERMAEYDPRKRQISAYQRYAGTERDVPLIVPSVSLIGATYRMYAYARPGAAYEFLRNTLGDKLFLKALHNYMSNWHGKHPIPYDFFNSMNSGAGENLDWYWKPWFFDFGYPDLSITKVVIGGTNLSVTVKKEGNIPIPIKLTFIYSDNTETEIYKDASVWSDGKDEIIITEKTTKTIEKIKLGDSHIPDVNHKRNTYIIEK